MNAIQKAICEDIFTSGNVIASYECVGDDEIIIQSYDVEYFGEKYTLTKNNGEWVYFYHC